MLSIVPNEGLIKGVPVDWPVLRCQLRESTEQDRTWNLVAGGDVGLSGAFAELMCSQGKTRDIFEIISPALKSADCALVNLESPLLSEWTPQKGFAGSVGWAKDIREVGVDLVHMASSHILDYGTEGFQESISAVKDAGVIPLGVGRTRDEAMSMVSWDAEGLCIGFLAAGRTPFGPSDCPVLWELDVEEMLEAIRKHRQHVDLLIVSLHWGMMQVDYPTAEQRESAHRFVDAGASAVLMHHSHNLQGLEVYQGSPICYNMGNLVFDPDEGELQKSRKFYHIMLEEQLTTCLFSLEWTCEGEFLGLTAIPLAIPRRTGTHREPFELYWPDRDRAMGILERLQRISIGLEENYFPILNKQLAAIRGRELRVSVDLIFRHGQIGRAWKLFTRGMKVLRRRVSRMIKRHG
jgi:hypothetical protein